MNNKDREALDKFVDEDTLSPEDTKKFAEMSDGERATFIAERFFEAGAKHGRAELQEELLLYKEAARSEAEFVNELTSVLDLKKETIVEMQNAYETLNAHDEMLISTVDKLKEENKKLRQALGSIENMSDSHSVMTKQEINLWVYNFLMELENE